MMKQTIISKDEAGKKLHIEREFDAPVDLVWKAWTDSSLLDLWWAPKPYKARTKRMDFRNGGHWLYAMVGPDGKETWCRADFQKIVDGKSYSADDNFCDEQGNPTYEIPGMHWENTFLPSGAGTKVTVVITFEKIEDMQTIIEMGIQEGFTAAQGNLDELLAARLQSR